MNFQTPTRNQRMSTGTRPTQNPNPAEPIDLTGDSDQDYEEPLPAYTPNPDRQPGGRLNPIVID